MFLWKEFLADSRGATTAEHAIIAGLIVVVVSGAILLLSADVIKVIL